MLFALAASLRLPFSPRLTRLVVQEDVLNNRHSAKSWLRYLAFKKDAAAAVRNMLYERALKAIPGSYKLWRRYLLERKARFRPIILSLIFCILWCDVCGC